MPVVRIRKELYARVTKLAVTATIETATPARQFEIIHYLLERILEDYTARELIVEYHELQKAIQEGQQREFKLQPRQPHRRQ